MLERERHNVTPNVEDPCKTQKNPKDLETPCPSLCQKLGQFGIQFEEASLARLELFFWQILELPWELYLVDILQKKKKKNLPVHLPISFWS